MFWLQGKHQRKYFWSKCFRILERKLLVHCNPAYILWISKNLKLFSMASFRFGYVLILGDRFPPWPTLWNCWASWGVWLRWLLWLRHLLEHQQHSQVSLSSLVWYSWSKICHRFGERTCDSPLALVTSAADFMASYQPPGLGKVGKIFYSQAFLDLVQNFWSVFALRWGLCSGLGTTRCIATTPTRPRTRWADFLSDDHHQRFWSSSSAKW